MTCSTPECGRPVLCKKRGLCSRCYQGARKAAGGSFPPDGHSLPPARLAASAAKQEGKLAAKAAVIEERNARLMAANERVKAATTERVSLSLSRNARAQGWHERMVAGERMAGIARSERLTCERVRQVLLAAGLPTRIPRPISGSKAKLTPRSRSLVRILSILDQFIQVGTKDECWLWTGGSYARNPKYPDYLMPINVLAFDPLDAPRCRTTLPYRLVHMLYRGPIPEGMTVDHTCFNPLCCNPNHLRLLTRAENSSLKNPDKHTERYQRNADRDAAIRIAYAEWKVLPKSSRGMVKDIAASFGMGFPQFWRIATDTPQIAKRKAVSA